MENKRIKKSFKISKKKMLFAVLLVAIQGCILFFNYRKVNIKYPIVYDSGDLMGVFYYAKMIDEFGIRLENPMTGGASGANMYDYPYADSLSFSIVKLIGLFFNNPFAIINLFYFLCSVLIALTSFYVMTRRGVDELLALSLSLLFSNSPFFQMRYTHMWLIPYFMIPIECDIALDVIDDKILGKEQASLKNLLFIRGLVLAFMCGFTGLYYAFFACVLFFSAFLIKTVKDGCVKRSVYSLSFILSTALACLVQYIPNIIFLSKHGSNNQGEMALRGIGESELYGMKFIQLILPRGGHRLASFVRLVGKYNANYPLINENMTACLGLVASLGFFIALLLIIRNDEKQKSEPFLILSVFLVATIGGIGSLFSLLVRTPMRCYNRMSLIIMFLSLIVFGKSLQSAMFRIHNKKIWAVIASVLIVIGVLDQTSTLSNNENVVQIIDDQKSFVHKIEGQLDKKAFVFQYPYVDWPSGGSYKMFIGYLFSDNLRWSYGAMQGREEAVWQKQVASKSIRKMLHDITEAGYTGLYVDKQIYEQRNGADSFQYVFDEVNRLTGEMPLINGMGDLFVWNLKQYVEINDAS